jgi:hypothetical protein
MSGADKGEGVDEFDWIARLLRPLAAGAPEALNLADDAAVIPSRPGYDLVISKDAIVAGVHFLPDDPLDLVARKLLRVNLSDLAAKGAAPAGYLLAIAWPDGLGCGGPGRIRLEPAGRGYGGDTWAADGQRDHPRLGAGGADGAALGRAAGRCGAGERNHR